VFVNFILFDIFLKIVRLRINTKINYEVCFGNYGAQNGS
jgi:hypothetical protein